MAYAGPVQGELLPLPHRLEEVHRRAARERLPGTSADPKRSYVRTSLPSAHTRSSARTTYLPPSSLPPAQLLTYALANFLTY